MNGKLIHAANWVKSNKLTLNINKTHYMLSHSNMTKPHHMKNKTDNITIQEAQEAKFLGVIFLYQVKMESTHTGC